MSQSKLLSRKDFFLYATKLSVPIMVQNLISTLVSSADTVMLGYVNQTAMAASSLANNYTFVLFCMYFGLTAATSVLSAQYFGKGDKDTVEKILGIAVKLTILVSAVFFVMSFFFPTVIMSLFTNSKDTIQMGAEYLKVVSFSFVFMGLSQIYVSALRSVGKVVFPSVTYVVSLIVNVIMNASFIFGLFGLPKLGVVGVALGTVIARFVETMMCIIYSWVNGDIRFRVKYIIGKSGVLLKDFFKIGLPTVANDVVWGLAASVFSAILGHIGDDMVAANAVAVMVVNIGAIACRGFANATTIIISTELGGNHIDNAKVYGGRMIRITLFVSLIGCLIMLLIRPFMIQFYSDKLTETALTYLGMLMIMTTWRLVGEGLNTCMICGCFRGGGDSKYGMILDTCYMWGVMVPVMSIAAFVLKLPALWVYFIMSMDEFGKMPLVIHHYLKFGWMKNITRDNLE